MAGLAVTVGPVVELNPVAGDHEYEVAPVALAVSVADCPAHMVALLTVVGETMTQLTVAVPKKFNGRVVLNEL